jgi:hypothetical protein
MTDSDSKKAQQLAQQKRKADVEWVMSTPAGRRYIKSLIDSCGLDIGGHIGSAEIHFRQGVREVGLRTKQEIENVCFAKYIEMLQEAQAK